ncbi:MAG: pentapeptide repeat-containing protein [Halobacteriota archaeon]|nr:pentapeptide repeat-containing protein [Halobacteriota archaeon]
MEREEIQSRLKLHKLWLESEGMEGERANFAGADLRDADFEGADFRYANCRGANFENANCRDANFKGADLKYATFEGADCRGADFQHADCREANFQDADCWRANFENADCRKANFQGANIDYSCWPLWCGSLDVKVDKRIARQLLYHAVAVSQGVLPKKCFSKALLDEVNKFHRVIDGSVPEV